MLAQASNSDCQGNWLTPAEPFCFRRRTYGEVEGQECKEVESIEECGFDSRCVVREQVENALYSDGKGINLDVLESVVDIRCSRIERCELGKVFDAFDVIKGSNDMDWNA